MMNISAKRDEFQTFAITDNGRELVVTAKNGKLYELQMVDKHGETLILLQGHENIYWLVRAVAKFLTDRVFDRLVE